MLSLQCPFCEVLRMVTCPVSNAHKRRPPVRCDSSRVSLIVGQVLLGDPTDGPSQTLLAHVQAGKHAYLASSSSAANTPPTHVLLQRGKGVYLQQLLPPLPPNLPRGDSGLSPSLLNASSTPTFPLPAVCSPASLSSLGHEIRGLCTFFILSLIFAVHRPDFLVNAASCSSELRLQAFDEMLLGCRQNTIPRLPADPSRSLAGNETGDAP